jgi:NADH-quinone oxidoreductase subunit F
MGKMEKVLTKYFNLDEYRNIGGYREKGGYIALKRALSMPADEIIEEVKSSGLRGRGGAGFPTGVKWGFIPKESGMPKYLVVNADEGEPGTFKDRLIMERGPHLLLEGIAIASYAIGAHISYIYIRGEFVTPTRIMEEAIEEAYREGILGKNIMGSGFHLDVFVHRGAGAYICGEETALIESLEGKKGQPRLKPPFPAQVGVFGGPTIVNNVETIADVPYIINEGGEKFASLGSEKNGGTRLFGLSGYVEKPGVFELPMGTNLREIIFNHGGGMKEGKNLKAVIPGGSSTPVLRPEEIDVPADFDSLMKAGSMAGSGGVIVIPEGVCMVRALEILVEFYAHESCGQCSPCREGTEWLKKIVSRIEKGNGQEGDLELIEDLCGNMMGQTICPLADAAGMPAMSFISKFREEFEYHIEHKKCLDNGIPI